MNVWKKASQKEREILNKNEQKLHAMFGKDTNRRAEYLVSSSREKLCKALFDYS
ncbi:TPA: hypothetical protein ACOEA3_000944 [Enterobacter hormaechei subsp. xiangfangensis]|uniref:hypothetical protein n=1 Tax=Enterobacter cloacae TaxID=550 RepID=UPI002FD18F32